MIAFAGYTTPSMCAASADRRAPQCELVQRALPGAARVDEDRTPCVARHRLARRRRAARRRIRGTPCSAGRCRTGHGACAGGCRARRPRRAHALVALGGEHRGERGRSPLARSGADGERIGAQSQPGAARIDDHATLRERLRRRAARCAVRRRSARRQMRRVLRRPADRRADTLRRERIRPSRRWRAASLAQRGDAGRARALARARLERGEHRQLDSSQPSARYADASGSGRW